MRSSINLSVRLFKLELAGHPTKEKVNNMFYDFKDDEEEKIKEITENIVKQIPTLIDKKIDLFSSKVNQNLDGI